MEEALQVEQAQNFEWNQKQYEEYLNSPENDFAKKLEVSKAYRVMKDAKNKYKTAVSALVTEESRQKARDMMDIVKRKQNSILDNPVSKETQESVLKLNTTEAEEELYNARKNIPLYSTDELICELKEHPTFDKLRKTKTLDLRKQRHRREPAKYIDGVMMSKRMYDMENRLAVVEQYMRINSSAQQVTENKLSNLTNELVTTRAELQALSSVTKALDSKIEFLLKMGVDSKKIALYKVCLEKPDLSKSELSKLTGVSRRTSYYWLEEISKTLDKMETQLIA